MREPCECGSAEHAGPHWRHMDALWREKNREILRRAHASMAAGNHMDARLALHGFGQEEERRLAEKAAHLRREEPAPTKRREAAEAA